MDETLEYDCEFGFEGLFERRRRLSDFKLLCTRHRHVRSLNNNK